MAEEEANDCKFDVLGLIGQGAFGKVFLLEGDEGTQYALKIVPLVGQNPKMVMQTLQEVKLLGALKHDYILRYVEASIQKGDMWMITEYCPNGDIGEYIKQNKGTAMEESRLLLWIQQITDALQYLHGFNPKIIHRDLKNDNIFLDKDWNTKLGDFGIARILESPASLAQTQCGTLLYMSPELFSGIPYTEKTDIFSLGIMMYEMCHMDKDLVSAQLILFKIVHDTLPTMPTGYDDGISELLTSMISKDPDDRPSATQILENDVFKTAQEPPPIESNGDGPQVEKLKDEQESRTLLGTLSQMQLGQFVHGGGGAARIGMSVIREEANNDEEGDEYGGVDLSSEEYETNHTMVLVYRTMIGMGKDTHKIQGDSMLEKQVEMLRVYCLQCMNNDDGLFQKASKALDSSMDEDELEELLIRVLGHEKYAMCGTELLYYKNFNYNLQQKK